MIHQFPLERLRTIVSRNKRFPYKDQKKGVEIGSCEKDARGNRTGTEKYYFSLYNGTIIRGREIHVYNTHQSLKDAIKV